MREIRPARGGPAACGGLAPLWPRTAHARSSWTPRSAFVAERILTDGDRLKPAYTVAGGPVPQQRRLPLPGHPGADVVVGNHVTDQFQSPGWE